MESTQNNPGRFKVWAYRCRCGYEWVPRNIRSKERPRRCAKCKDPNWDRPYLFKRVNGKPVPVA